jgi:hypothetical protein
MADDGGDEAQPMKQIDDLGGILDRFAKGHSLLGISFRSRED